MADKAHILTDKKLEEMERRLSAIYSEAQKDIQKKSDEYFDKFKKADEEKRKLVKQGKLTDEEYKTWRQNKIMYGKRFTAMKEDVAKQLLNVNQTATAYINGELPEVYTLNYNALAETVDGVGGYSFTLTDRDTVKHLATTDKILLPFRELDPAKDIPWNMKKINGQVLQGIMQGESIPKISKRIMNVQEMNKDAAIRSARTIVTGAENKGRLDSFKRAEADGIILQKEWLSSDQPGRTRDWHLPHSFESLVVDIDKPFVNGMGKIMFPGDPAAHPANVYNCRCSMASVVKGFKKAQVEKAMEEQNKMTLPEKPIRPNKADYGGLTDEYYEAREKYKSEREAYISKRDDIVKKNLERPHRFSSTEEIEVWARKIGIEIDEGVLDFIDIRVFDDLADTTEEMFAKYPFLRKEKLNYVNYGETVDRQFRLGLDDLDALMSANGGLRFGSDFKDYETVLGITIDQMASGFNVRGDGTIKTLFRHEFGHTVETHITAQLPTEERREFYKELRSMTKCKGVSEYSMTNEGEFFAEGFAEYTSSGKSELGKSFGEFLERWLK